MDFELGEKVEQHRLHLARFMEEHIYLGVSQDTPIHGIFTASRYGQIADGPDEVHMSQLGKLTMRGR